MPEPNLKEEELPREGMEGGALQTEGQGGKREAWRLRKRRELGMVGPGYMMGEPRVKAPRLQSEEAGEGDRVQVARSPAEQLFHKPQSHSCTVQGMGLGQCGPY